jgi:hypothetical protein
VLVRINDEWDEFHAASSISNRIAEATNLIILLSHYVDKATGGVGAQVAVDDQMRLNRAK